MIFRKFITNWRFNNLLKSYRFFEKDTGDLKDIVNTDFFILSLPKCATSSLHYTLIKSGINSFHGHTNDWLYRTISNGEVLKKKGIGWEEIIKYRLKNGRGKIYILCGFREPVSRYFSLANELHLSLNNDLKKRMTKNINEEKPWSQLTSEKVFDLLKRITRINVLDYPFDFKKGFVVFHHDNIELIVYRIDAVNNLSQYIRKNLVANFELTSYRIAENLEYTEFMKNLKLPSKDLDKIFDDKFVKHFYTEEEIVTLINKYKEAESY